MSYATDGVCHNAEPGTYGHECGKLAVWIGTAPSGFRSGFCDRCKRTGAEARDRVAWEAIPDMRPIPPGKTEAYERGWRACEAGAEREHNPFRRLGAAYFSRAYDWTAAWDDRAYYNATAA